MEQQISFIESKVLFKVSSARVGSFYLVDVIQVGSLVGPVVVALLHPALDKRRQHNNNHAAVLPHHLQPEHTVRLIAAAGERHPTGPTSPSQTCTKQPTAQCFQKT